MGDQAGDNGYRQERRGEKDYEGRSERENYSSRNAGRGEEERKPRVPISLEDLKRKKEEERMAESKPVFMSKAERRARAVAEREAEVAKMKSESSASSFSNSASSRQHYEERESYGSRSAHYRPNDRQSREEEERRIEIEKIRQEKMGVVQLHQRKAVRGAAFRTLTKPTHWDDTEDTARDAYAAKFQSDASSLKPQFGRGELGGMMSLDQDEEKEHYDSKDKRYEGSKDQAGREGSRNGNAHRSQAHGGGSGQSHTQSFSWSKKPISEMTTRDWRIMREDFEISVKGKGNVPNPMRAWNESSLPNWALEAIKDAGYTSPTAIQRQAIPIGLEGRDMIGLAETGSGKTASFLLPLLVHIVNLKKNLSLEKLEKRRSQSSESRMEEEGEREGPYACVLAPTRELAMQIKIEADKFSKYADCRTVLLIGGEDQTMQISQLRQGADIIVATAGRLVDLLQNAWISLMQCKYVVLDEGDRMIDMGFEEQLHQILDSMPSSDKQVTAETSSSNLQASNSKNKPSSSLYSNSQLDMRNMARTTILFSATMPPAVERIANKYLRNPVTIYVGDVGKAVERIKQNVEYYKTDSDKRRRLQELLMRGPKPPIIIFMNHKASCDAIGRFVEKLGFAVSILHSGKTQDAREQAITLFKQFKTDVLIATNVAGRGLDVKGVTHVINYDLPESIEEYTHRIGRTGRAGLDGTATSFLTPSDEKILPGLKALLQKTNSKIPKELTEMLSHSSLRPLI